MPLQELLAHAYWLKERRVNAAGEVTRLFGAGE
jgi:hypothetical protein